MGKVTCERYLVAYDIGRAVNPKLVEGQIVGGFAQGLGGALLEEFRYDEAGQPGSVTFMDYMLPTATDVPSITVVHRSHPTYLNPLGVKGAGEGATASAPAAIANAICDALTEFGVEITEMPITPARLLDLIDLGRD
jgi:CO/xanthine dehydrogenase Mo-binding subunit